MKMSANERRCKICGIRKPLTSFEPDAWNPKNKNADTWVRACYTCKELHKYVELPGNINLDKLRKKGSAIQRSYGISLNKYETLYIEQNGVCAICHHPEPVKSRLFLAVDHNHRNGIVRGLLCSNCNMALGLFKDSTEFLYSAIRYLKKSS
jgi:hypothetical protein